MRSGTKPPSRRPCRYSEQGPFHRYESAIVADREKLTGWGCDAARNLTKARNNLPQGRRES